MKFWTEQFLNWSVEEIEAYVGGFQRRILPAFAEIEIEANRLSENEFKRLGETLSPEHYDAADIAEMAHSKAIRYYETVFSTRQGVVNLFVVGLYHILEQQFDYLVIRMRS